LGHPLFYLLTLKRGDLSLFDASWYFFPSGAEYSPNRFAGTEISPPRRLLTSGLSSFLISFFSSEATDRVSCGEIPYTFFGDGRAPSLHMPLEIIRCAFRLDSARLLARMTRLPPVLGPKFFPAVQSPLPLPSRWSSASRVFLVELANLLSCASRISNIPLILRLLPP